MSLADEAGNGPRYIVGIGGTTRAASSTEHALRYVLGVCEQSGAETDCFVGSVLATLPYYAPELPHRSAEATRLVAALRRADGIVIASSSYHAGLSGLVKNALDYAEDMRAEDPCYFTGRPVGCIATGSGWQGVVTTLKALRDVVHALRGWPTPMGAAINTAQPVFDADGDAVDEKARFQLTTVANELMSFLNRQSIPLVPVTR
jgi:FMN reductase